MKELFQICFKGSEIDFVSQTKFDTIWANDNNKIEAIFDKASLHGIIKLMLDNRFWNFGILSILQIVGIPMGFYSAYFMTNIYQYYYEKEDIYKEHTFSINLLDLIDDL